MHTNKNIENKKKLVIILILITITMVHIDDRTPSVCLTWNILCSFIFNITLFLMLSSTWVHKTVWAGFDQLETSKLHIKKQMFLCNTEDSNKGTT